MKKTLLCIAVLLSMGLSACIPQKTTTSEQQQNSSNLKNAPKSFVAIFEIPATDISRAVDFYQTILGIHIETIDMPGMEMGLFPSEGQMVYGVIVKGEGYTPSQNGPTIYLNGGDNLQTVLDKVEKSGGKVLVPKTLHADESGYFALFLDSEGNKIGLHSLN